MVVEEIVSGYCQSFSFMARDSEAGNYLTQII